MNFLEAAVLGLVQGLTEFLPVSSTAHLLIAQRLFGMAKEDLHVEVATHLGTSLAVVVHYRKWFAELARDTARGGPGRRVVGLVILASAMLVLAIAVQKLAPGVKAWRLDVRVAGMGLLGIGVFLLASKWFPRGERPVGPAAAIGMGIAQSVAAIVPGCSRSGSTIGTGLLLGVDPAAAGRFSFLMSIPAVLGGAAWKLREEPAFAPGEVPLMLLAAAIAFVSGLAAIRMLLAVLGKGRLHWFGVYCIAVGAAVLLAWGQG